MSQLVYNKAIRLPDPKKNHCPSNGPNRVKKISYVRILILFSKNK